MGDTTRGLYPKFTVTRTDGQSMPGLKHHGCEYFVLDLTHDPHALAAIRAYALSCRREYPLLARDLASKLPIEDPKRGWDSDRRDRPCADGNAPKSS